MTEVQGHVSRDENGETRTGSVVAGRYRLLERLGAGGFGRVWRARDDKLGVDVAIKEVWLPPAMSAEAHAERVLRAEREARNAARLRDHPNVVAVHDVVVDAGVPWTVMQLIDGRTLEEHVEVHGPLSPENGALVARAMLKALGAAHAAGIVHRDVKPANVMLTTDHEVVLTDFGIAQQEADTSLTQTGTLIGSVEYIAPERLRGEEGQGISDLFSLGVTLYHAVEGFSPFHRDTATGAMTAVLFEEAPAPRYAGALTPLITGLMEKDPARRLTSAQALDMLDRPQAAPRTSVQQAPRSATGPMPGAQPGSPSGLYAGTQSGHQSGPQPAPMSAPAAAPRIDSRTEQRTTPVPRPPQQPVRQGPPPTGRPQAVRGPAQTGPAAQGAYPPPAPRYVHPVPPRQQPTIAVGGWWMYLLPVALMLLFAVLSAASHTATTASEDFYQRQHPVNGAVGALVVAGAGWLAVFTVMFLLRGWRVPARIIGYIGAVCMLIGYWSYDSALKRYTHTAALHGRTLHFADHTGALVFAGFVVAAGYTVFEILTRRAYRRLAAKYGR